LSSGNRRKVGLVGAFMARPELLILDEPTAGVDPLVQAEVLELILEARDEGRTVFLSSHVLSDVQRVADDVIVIRAGKVVASGDVDELRRAARQEFAVWFAGSAPGDELRKVPGVRDLETRGSEARGVVEGDPNRLLAVLARHRVTHVVLPEPDLEQAFLRFYEDGAR
jgi:ABC-2 type transport system ATP-binding protein